MLHRLDSCHIGIISYPFTSYNNIYCAPNKIFEYAAMGLPFIATEQPIFKHAQEQYHTGRVFRYNDISSFVKETQELVKTYSEDHQFAFPDGLQLPSGNGSIDLPDPLRSSCMCSLSQTFPVGHPTGWLFFSIKCDLVIISPIINVIFVMSVDYGHKLPAGSRTRFLDRNTSALGSTTADGAGSPGAS